MKKTCLTLVATVVILLQSVCFSRAVLINFDVDAYGNPVTAPLDFYQTTPLTDLYAPLGVLFNGPSAGNGGKILNDNDGGPGGLTILALSGPNYLAFSAMALNDASDPETVTFDIPMSSVSIFATGGAAYGGTFTMQAFSTEGVLLDTSVTTTPPDQWGELNVSSSDGIGYIVLQNNNNGFLPEWAYDNLNAIPVPEPNILPLASSGLIFALLRCPNAEHRAKKRESRRWWFTQRKSWVS